MKRKAIAQQTVEILQRGQYQTGSGKTVEIKSLLDQAVNGTRTYLPEDFDAVFQEVELLKESRTESSQTKFEVVNGTTLAAARKLVEKDPSRSVVCLNFASAKNPGGGFLAGSQAQEESLARASGLYACIEPQRDYYDANRACQTCLYTDHVIHSPTVPVFRDDRDELLEQSYQVSMITAPAVNAGAVQSNEPHNVSRIEQAMLKRMEYVLSVALRHDHDTLVLGAWGCGVFRNDPQKVASWFHQLLTEADGFQNAFDHVVFAVLDSTADHSVLQPFQRLFAGAVSR